MLRLATRVEEKTCGGARWEVDVEDFGGDSELVDIEYEGW